MPSSYKLKAVNWMVVREPPSTWPVLSNPEAVAKILPHLLPDDDRERFIVILLNAQNRYLSHHEVSVGTLTSSLIHPREVFKPAFLTPGAAQIVVAHNHPSGDPTPSTDDITLTRELAHASKILRIRLHDHLIWGSGSGRWVSFQGQGLL